MIFDQFCGTVERHLPEFKKMLEEAALFTFDEVPHKFLKERAGFHDTFDPDLFHLPFPIVAVEDPGGLVVLVDEHKDALGLDKRRFFIDVQWLNHPIEHFQHVQKYSEEARKAQKILVGKYPKGLGVSIGILEGSDLSSDRRQFQSSFEACRQILVDKKKGIVMETEPMGLLQGVQPGARNANVALEELALLSRPKDFVLETAPSSAPKIRKGNIPRSHQRSTYTILEPLQIRKQMGLARPEQAGGKVRAHERRRHLRRYVPGNGKPWKEEKIVVIDARWIGEKESVQGKKKYRVRIDI